MKNVALVCQGKKTLNLNTEPFFFAKWWDVIKYMTVSEPAKPLLGSLKASVCVTLPISWYSDPLFTVVGFRGLSVSIFMRWSQHCFHWPVTNSQSSDFDEFIYRYYKILSLCAVTLYSSCWTEVCLQPLSFEYRVENRSGLFVFL